MKKSLLFIGILAVILTSCRREALVNFSYTVSDKYDSGLGISYVLLTTYNLSLNAISYEWELEGPYGDVVTSHYESPTFKCYQSGDYVLRLYAYSRNGDYKMEAKHIYINLSSGGGSSQTPTSYTIKWLRLEAIPMQDGNNASWDTGIFGGEDPDIYFKIFDSSNHLLYTSSTVTDLSASDLPYIWYNVNTTLSYSESKYLIRFYDKDGDLDADDLMIGCNLTTSYLYPGSSTYVWYNNNAGVRFTIGTSWAY